MWVEKREPYISIVMVAKNGLQYLQRSLPLILHQEIDYTYEVLIIDSGSVDGSVEFIHQVSKGDSRVALKEIPAHEFHHARTRNLGMRLTKGNLVVFLGGDAIPANTTWLFNLVMPVVLGESIGIAASYGKQIPREDADIGNFCRVTFNYDDNFIIKQKNSLLTRKELFFFSSVNCCIHRNSLKNISPYFDEHVNVNEDITLSYRLINNNYKIVYCPDAAVIHSHNLSCLEILFRYFDNAVTYSKAGIFFDYSPAVKEDKWKFLRHSLKILQDKDWKAWGKFALFFLAAATGLGLGLHYQYLPRVLARRLSPYNTV